MEEAIDPEVEPKERKEDMPACFKLQYVKTGKPRENIYTA